jgi:hypothetical protein
MNRSPADTLVAALEKHSLTKLAPKASNITIVETTTSSLKLEALVNITNPTPYTAFVPYVNIYVISSGSIIGEVSAENLNVTLGNNTNLKVSALWNPSLGGDKGIRKGRDLLSSYLSGFNTSVTLQAHKGSIPMLPGLGQALSRLNLTVSAPRISLPGKDEEEKSKFIRDATFHVFSSTATFTLVSPLERNTLYIEHVNATAFYNHTEPIGHILYDLPFACPPAGPSQTPKLPVDWSLGSVGYEKLRSALGGTMKLDAEAIVGLRVGAWSETLWYIGKGIAASVRV